MEAKVGLGGLQLLGRPQHVTLPLDPVPGTLRLSGSSWGSTQDGTPLRPSCLPALPCCKNWPSSPKATLLPSFSCVERETLERQGHQGLVVLVVERHKPRYLTASLGPMEGPTFI